MLRLSSFGIIKRTYTAMTSKTRTERMREILQESLEATHLDLINESHMHSVPKNSETHFKVVIVSPQFQGTSLISRHRLVQDLLKDELKTGLHALSIVAKTPTEWAKSNPVEPSPTCMGGFGK